MWCITMRAISAPQCKAMISDKGFGRRAQGYDDHGEAELWRLMVAVAVVWTFVSIVATPSGLWVWTIAMFSPRFLGSPE